MLLEDPAPIVAYHAVILIGEYVKLPPTDSTTAGSPTVSLLDKRACRSVIVGNEAGQKCGSLLLESP